MTFTDFVQFVSPNKLNVQSPWNIVLCLHDTVINKADLSAAHLSRASEIELAGSNVAVALIC
jgi:hypothetical protein